MKKKKQPKMSAAEFEAKRKALYDSYGGVKKKVFKPLAACLEHGREDKYPSVIGTGKAECGRLNMMSKENLAKETPEVRDEIIRKSKRLVPLYSKGPVQFMTDDADPTDAGKKK